MDGTLKLTATKVDAHDIPILLSHVTPFHVQQFVPFIQEFVLAYDWIPWYKSQWNEIELSWGSENEFLNWSKAELCSGWQIGIDKVGEKEGKDGGASNMRKQE